jgi:hypothetical protein
VHRHLVIFASLFLFLWAAISIGCSSKSAQESSDSSAPSGKSASLFGPKEVTLPAGTVITVRLATYAGFEDEQHRRPFQCNDCNASRVRRQSSAPQGN